MTRGKSGKGVTGRGNNTCRALGVSEKKGAVWAEGVRGARGGWRWAIGKGADKASPGGHRRLLRVQWSSD